MLMVQENILDGHCLLSAILSSEIQQNGAAMVPVGGQLRGKVLAVSPRFSGGFQRESHVTGPAHQPEDEGRPLLVFLLTR